MDNCPKSRSLIRQSNALKQTVNHNYEIWRYCNLWFHRLLSVYHITPAHMTPDKTITNTGLKSVEAHKKLSALTHVLPRSATHNNRALTAAASGFTFFTHDADRGAGLWKKVVWKEARDHIPKFTSYFLSTCTTSHPLPSPCLSFLPLIFFSLVQVVLSHCQHQHLIKPKDKHGPWSTAELISSRGSDSQLLSICPNTNLLFFTAKVK